MIAILKKKKRLIKTEFFLAKKIQNLLLNTFEIKYSKSIPNTVTGILSKSRTETVLQFCTG